MSIFRILVEKDFFFALAQYVHEIWPVYRLVLANWSVRHEKSRPSETIAFTLWTNELYKDTEPLMSFFFNWHVKGLCGIVFNRFYRLEIHSLMAGIFDPACELLPPWTKELSLCTDSPLPSLWPPPPLPKLNVQYVQTVCGCGGGGGVELCCRPYSAGVLHSVSDQIQNLHNWFTTPNKLTSKDGILGLVTLKFPSSMLCTHRENKDSRKQLPSLPPPPHALITVCKTHPSSTKDPKCLHN